MIRALYSAASGMNAQQMSIDNIANNLANANTVGYKARRTQFQDLLYQNVFCSPARRRVRRPSFRTACSSASVRARRPIPSSSRRAVFSRPDNPLDLVIQGKGFFQIKLPIGHHRLHARRAISSWTRRQYRRLARQSAASPQITLPAAAQSVTIAPDGTVSYTLPGQTAAQVAGQIQLAEFHQSGRPEQPGQTDTVRADRCLAAILTVGNPGGQEGLGTLQQGYTEESNVSVVEEFVNMIISQRAYEANSKVVKAADEMYQQVNNIAV